MHYHLRHRSRSLALVLAALSLSTMNAIAQEKQLPIRDFVQEQVTFYADRQLAPCKRSTRDVSDAATTSQIAFESRVTAAMQKLGSENPLLMNRMVPEAALGIVKLGMLQLWPTDAPSPPESVCRKLILEVNALTGSELSTILLDLAAEAEKRS